MLVKLFKDSTAMAEAAAQQAAATIKRAIGERDRCRIVLATGTSQFQFLDALTATEGIDWKKVDAFHLDEYVGIPVTHPASFRKILLERVVQKTGIVSYYFLKGDASDLSSAIENVARQLTSAPIDIAFVGIGENGHIAFNDPPADFESEDPYLVVELDEACRRQQVGEGWFNGLSQVPTRAISMSPRQIMKAREIVAVVPDQRKAKAVQSCLEGKVRPDAPASILRQHPNATLFLDDESSSLLSAELRSKLDQQAQVVVGP
jgi:glucosamine-6-phosphate deaminase